MFWQREYIREGAALTLNSTYRLDLPEHGILSAILIKIEGTNKSGHGQGAHNWRVLDNITAIEVILNGSTVCKSIRGDMVQATAFYDNGVVAPDLWRHYGENTQYGYFLLDFGRHLYDRLLGLDLGKFKNVELRITNNASSTTEFGSLTVSILAFYLRDFGSASPIGYIRSETWREWTTVTDATEYLELPTEHPIRRIILQAIPAQGTASLNDTAFYNLMDDVDLSLDTGQVRVYKGGADEITKSNLYEYGRPIITGGEVYQTDTKGVDTGIGNVLKTAHGGGEVSGTSVATIPAYEVTNSNNCQILGTYEADAPIRTMWEGDGYHNTAVFRFDYDADPFTWLDPKARATVNLNVHTRNSATADNGTNRVILDRFVRV